MRHMERAESLNAPRYRNLVHPALRSEKDERAVRQEDLLDAALLETFPASDPISVFRLA